MKKQTKPNLQFILKSAISALQVTYNDYKRAIINDLNCSFYSDDGEFTFLSGKEERKRKIEFLGNEVVRLQVKVDYIKNKIKESEGV